MRTMFCAVIVVAITTIAGAAHAGKFAVWHQAGGGCVPTEIGSTFPNYSTSGGSIASLNGTELSLVCPVTNPIDPNLYGHTCTSYTLDVRMSGTSLTIGRVYPYLIAVSTTTGAETVIANAGGDYITKNTFYDLSWIINTSVAGTQYVQVYLDGTQGGSTVMRLFSVEIDCNY